MKNARPRSSGNLVRQTSSNVNALDQAESCCMNITAVGELLACCQAAHLDSQAVPYIGHLLLNETVKLRAAMHKLNAEFAKRNAA